jgi:anti-anti-sigma regulatory factor
VFSPYFKERGSKVIVNLGKIEKVELVTLLGVLTSIRKEITFLKGELKLCSLKPALLTYFKETRLDHFFQIYEDEEKAKKSEWKEYEKNL